MIEVMMKLAAALTTTQTGVTATTGGPFKIPSGYPDIAWMSTTTAAAQLALHHGILLSTTTNSHIKERNAPKTYTARAFNFKTKMGVTDGSILVVKYRPVGDLVRA